jgi:hypothetical protein
MTNKDNQPRHRLLKYFFIFGGSLIAIILIAYWALAAMYQNNISDMKKVFSDANQQILLPEGGREHWSTTVTHGASLLESFCIDSNCPQVEAYWYVPLTTSGYIDFENKIINYIKNEPVFRKHQDWKVQVYPAEVSSLDINKLPKSVDNKTWQGVHIFLYK